MNVAFTRVQLPYLLFVDVEPSDAEAFFGKEQRERQAHIAEPNDPEPRRSRIDARQPFAQTICRNELRRFAHNQPLARAMRAASVRLDAPSLEIASER